MADALTGRTYDVVVAGAGIVGLASAWRAAQRGLRVLVLDRGRAGAGATGAAAGMLAPVTEAEFGEEALLRLNLAGASVWPAFAAELAERTGIDLGYRECGALVVAADRDDLEEVRRLHAFQRSLGLDAEWLGGRECRRLEPGLSPRVAGGVLARHDHQVDPRAVVPALRAAFEAAGGELVEGCAVLGIEASPDGAVAGVSTERGSVVAERVVVAAGAWTAELGRGSSGTGFGTDLGPGLDPASGTGFGTDLGPGLDPASGTGFDPPPGPGFDPPPVRPVKGQIVRLAGPAGAAHPLAERIVRTPRCYAVPRQTGEVVIGATVEERGFDESVTAGGVHRLLEAAWEVLPDVEERALTETAASFRPGTPDNAPIVGPGSPEGLIWATGHHRNGILLAPLTAAAVTELLTGSVQVKGSVHIRERLQSGELLTGSDPGGVAAAFAEFGPERFRRAAAPAPAAAGRRA